MKADQGMSLTQLDEKDGFLFCLMCLVCFSICLCCSHICCFSIDVCFLPCFTAWPAMAIPYSASPCFLFVTHGIFTFIRPCVFGPNLL